MGLLFSYCFSLSIRIYCLFLSPPIQFVLGLAREDLSCPEIEISDSSILKETAAARLDAESLSNRSPTSGKVWFWYVSYNPINETVDFIFGLSIRGEWESVGVGWCVELDNQQEKSGIKAEFPE